ncbi:hypothetical protein MANES_07G094902v8 [Manihot esculenta]|uniref:Uncharacterized protein n=1 Tax=Manihot esculenta TaxID=3983 RepID=A0ACB7HG23_MANES|nr:hypothetical protein MANES_07G094902v8 [Manihot esculenta]
MHVIPYVNNLMQPVVHQDQLREESPSFYVQNAESASYQ